MNDDEMKRQAPLPSPRLERELEDLLGAAPRLPDERLRRVRLAVHDNLQAQPPLGLPPWLRWNTLLPAAAALLLLGGVLGWTLGDRIEIAAGFGGSMSIATPGGL